MRYFLLCFSILTLSSLCGCKDGDATSSTTSNAPITKPSIPTTVEHYICPNGHAGFGGENAGTCSQCGATLEHNAAFHNEVPPADLTTEANNIIEDVPSPENSLPTNPGVEHYICPNGHVGSGGPGEGTCSNCGVALVHNDAFHNTPAQSGFPAATPNSAPTEQIMPQPSGAVSPIFQNASSAPILGGAASTGGSLLPEPAQNAAGIWHYICIDGHAGGAGSAIACSQCGKTLVHNEAYHN